MATIKDVAKLAGVSVGSVSKYLNGYKLKDKTRLAIEAAIQALNYEPNIYAKGLKTNRTHTVVLMVPTVWHPFFGELTYYIEQALQTYKMKLILCNTGDDIDKEVEFFAMARQNKVDGIIAISYSNIDDYVTAHLPVVSIDRFFSTQTDFISSDNYQGGYLGAQQLVEAGCRHLAYIGHSSPYQNDTKSRLDGFKRYCKSHDIPYEICYSEKGKTAFQAQLAQFMQQLKADGKIDGILTASYSHALKVLEALEDLGLEVPRDLQLIGFDGSKSSASGAVFLSSIRQDVPRIAQTAVDLLMNRLENPEAQVVHQRIPVTFIKGKTSR